MLPVRLIPALCISSSLSDFKDSARFNHAYEIVPWIMFDISTI